MSQSQLNISISPGVRKATILSGVLLLLTGAIGIIVPQVVSIALSLFIAWLFIAAGVLSGYFNWHSYRGTWAAWLKTFVLILLGLLLAFHPAAGVATLGLFLAIYFLFDAFAGISFGLELRPQSGWGWMFFNGLLSMILALMVLISWPFGAIWIVGFLVGISLFFDGVVLLMLGLKANSL